MERGQLWTRAAHGRTRMIVFPLTRTVGSKAATASSRVEALPIFGRSRSLVRHHDRLHLSPPCAACSPARQAITSTVRRARAVTTPRSFHYPDRAPLRLHSLAEFAVPGRSRQATPALSRNGANADIGPAAIRLPGPKRNSAIRAGNWWRRGHDPHPGWTPPDETISSGSPCLSEGRVASGQMRRFPDVTIASEGRGNGRYP